VYGSCNTQEALEITSLSFKPDEARLPSRNAQEVLEITSLSFKPDEAHSPSRNAQEMLEIPSLSIKPDEAHSPKLTRQWHMPSMPAKLVQSSAAPSIPEAGSISLVLGDDRQFHIFEKGFLAHPVSDRSTMDLGRDLKQTTTETLVRGE
jgi:hypothetical protein